jgi:hypothetical protein
MGDTYYRFRVVIVIFRWRPVPTLSYKKIPSGGSNLLPNSDNFL